jgi:DNA polymerase sigma
MLIHFLQRVQPPVLPYLQDKEKFGLKTEIIDNCEVQFYQPKKDYKKMFRKNEMSVGKLFVGFFEYFADFDWNNEVVQIRNSNKMFKLEKDWNQPFVAIEDPFILSRNLSSGIRGSSGLKL